MNKIKYLIIVINFKMKVVTFNLSNIFSSKTILINNEIKMSLILIICFLNLSVEYRLAAEFIAKMTKIEKISEVEVTNSIYNTCKDNPLLYIFPESLANDLRESFEDGDLLVVNNDNLKGCNIFDSPKQNCCNDDTLSIFKNYIKDEILVIKKRIFEKNSKIYELIINEHNRNFNAFGISQEIFEETFKKYKLIKDEIRLKHERILNETLTFSWNSFCNLICRNPSELKSFCRVFNETIAVNEKMYWKLKYKCSIDVEHNDKINILLLDFDQYIKSLNSTLDKYYEEIYEDSKIISNNIGNNTILSNNRILSSTSTSKNENLNSTNNQNNSFSTEITNVEIKYFLENSIKDGHYVSKSLTQLPYCNTINPNCNGLLNKTCIPFYCYDDLFLQFSDSTTIDFNSILTNTSYVSVNIDENGKNSKNLYSKTNIEKDEYLLDILESTIRMIFADNVKLSIRSIFLYFLILVIN